MPLSVPAARFSGVRETSNIHGTGAGAAGGTAGER